MSKTNQQLLLLIGNKTGVKCKMKEAVLEDKIMRNRNKNHYRPPIDASSAMTAERIHIPVPKYERSIYRNEDDEIRFQVNMDIDEWPLSPRIRRNTFLTFDERCQAARFS